MHSSDVQASNQAGAQQSDTVDLKNAVCKLGISLTCSGVLTALSGLPSTDWSTGYVVDTRPISVLPSHFEYRV